MTDGLRDLAVAARLAVRNVQQRFPNGALKIGAASGVLDFESSALARAVFLDLPTHFGDRAFIANRVAVDRRRASGRKVEADEPAFLIDPRREG